MLRLDVLQFEKMTSGEIIVFGEDRYADNIAVDSRKAIHNTAFFALKGENTDGHKFALSAVKNGATICIVNRKIEGLDCYQIKVDDVNRALLNFTRRYRMLFNIPLIAVTGSAGKTSTKEMISSVLSEKFTTMKTIGNLNSTTGLPLTISSLDYNDEIAVVEMGMSHRGEIAPLSKAVKPNCAVITNVGLSHVENLGSKYEISREKLDITKGMQKGDLLLVNGDDEFLSTLTSPDLNVIKFGMFRDKVNFRAYNCNFTNKDVTFDIQYRKKEYNFKVNIPGDYGVYNALCAIYIGFYYGLSYEEIQKGIYSFESGENRMKQSTLYNATIINDTYNSNPDALNEALKTLKRIAGNKTTVAVLGDMLELGIISKNEHCNAGKTAFKYGIDKVYTIGKDSRFISDSFSQFCPNKNNVKHFTDSNELIKFLKMNINKNDVILFKGSRGMHLDRVIKELKREEHK